jgi:hypothetical protein
MVGTLSGRAGELVAASALQGGPVDPNAAQAAEKQPA